jgi:hypothetical protein
MLFSTAFAQPTKFSDSIVGLAQSRIMKMDQINYTCKFRSLSVGEADTFETVLKVKLKRAREEKGDIFRKQVVELNPARPNYEFRAFFDTRGGFYYSINKERKEAKFYKFSGGGHNIRGYTFSGFSNFTDSTLSRTFSSSQFNDVTFVGADTFNGVNVYVLESHLEDDALVKNYRTLCYLNVTDLMPVRIRSTCTVGSEFQMRDFQILKYSNTQDENSQFFDATDVSGYKIIYDTLPDDDELTYGLLNHFVPDIFGLNIMTLKKEKISFKRRITVIDFWYMGCYGCMLSYPVIDSLRNRYGRNEELQFIGLNSVDRDSRLAERRKKYIKDHQVTPVSYVIEKETFDSFKENAMPFFIIIDQYGIIRYQCVGYHPDLFNQLSYQIETLLNK